MTSYSNPYNGDGCGTQNTGQKAVPFLLLFLREILHIAKIIKIWESTRPYDKKLFSPKENVSYAGMIVEQITFRIHI